MPDMTIRNHYGVRKESKRKKVTDKKVTVLARKKVTRKKVTAGVGPAETCIHIFTY